MLIFIHGHRRSSNKFLLFVLTDATVFGRRGHFVVWMFELASFYGPVGIWMLFVAVAD